MHNKLSIKDTLAIVDTVLSPKHAQQTLNKGHSHYSGHCSQSQTHVYYTTANSLNRGHSHYSGHCSHSQTCLLNNSKLPQ